LKFFGAKISAKKCSYNVDEIDIFRQIHQHFTKSFYANIIAPKNYKCQTVTREKLQKVLSYKKVLCEMMMKFHLHTNNRV